jgi:hypothetical protein
VAGVDHVGRVTSAVSISGARLNDLMALAATFNWRS